MSDPSAYQSPGSLPPAATYGPAPGLVYATFGTRFWAWVIDSLVIAAISGTVEGILGVDLTGDFGRIGSGLLPHLSFGLLIAAMIVTAISGIYHVYSWRTWNGTPGQRLLGLQVRNAADGSTITQETAIKRWVLLRLPIISDLGLFSFLALLYIIFLAVTTSNDPFRRGWHDKQVGTVVVRELR